MQAATYNLYDNSLSNDIECTNKPLQINCVGITKMDTAFISHIINGRKDFYLQYIIKGNLDVKINDGREILTAGTMILYYPNIEYTYTMPKDDELIYLWVHFTGYDADKLVYRCNIKDKTPINIGLDEEIILSFQSIINEFISRDDFFDDMCITKLKSLLFSLARKKDLSSDKSIITNKIYKSVLYINENFTKDIDLKHLSKMLHFSDSYYRKIFKTYTNQSPTEYITKMRINHSAQLLTTTDLSISEISELSGYSDPLYFSRIFKNNIGISPRNYRNKHL